MRVLYVTFAPSTPPCRQRIRSLAATLRSDGDQLLVAVAPATLRPEDASDADAFGLEYVFVVTGSGRRVRSASGWRRLLTSFRPGIVHVGADVPLEDARTLVRAARRASAEAIVEVNPEHAAFGVAPEEGQQGLGRAVYQCATQVVCLTTDAASHLSQAFGVPLALITPLIRRPVERPEATPSSHQTLAVLCDETDIASVNFAVRLLTPILLAHDTLHLVFETDARRVVQAATANLPEEVRARIALPNRHVDWLNLLGGAAGAIVSQGDGVAIGRVGATLVTGMPVVMPSEFLARLGDLRDQHWPGVIAVPNGDFQQSAQAVLSLLDDTGADAGMSGTILAARELHEAERLAWLYRAVLLRAGRSRNASTTTRSTTRMSDAREGVSATKAR